MRRMVSATPGRAAGYLACLVPAHDPTPIVFAAEYAEQCSPSLSGEAHRPSRKRTGRFHGASAVAYDKHGDTNAATVRRSK